MEISQHSAFVMEYSRLSTNLATVRLFDQLAVYLLKAGCDASIGCVVSHIPSHWDALENSRNVRQLQH